MRMSLWLGRLCSMKRPLGFALSFTGWGKRAPTARTKRPLFHPVFLRVRALGRSFQGEGVEKRKTGGIGEP